MRVIGLTGSIGCGKTTVSQELLRLGIPVVDGDQISRRLTSPGGAALPAVREAFGPGIFKADGVLDRRALGRLVFSDPARLSQLDRVMAPFLEREIRDQMDAVRSSGAPLCVLDLPLLFEKGYDALCDTVWTVWLPREEQLNRLMRRDGYTREEALSRMSVVMSSDEKASRSSVVIDNTGPVEETLSSLPALLDAERNRVSVRRRRNSPQSSAADAVPSSGASVFSQSPLSVPEPAVSLRSQHESDASLHSHEAPVRSSVSPKPVMDRPGSARRKPSARKIAWKMPVWLIVPLITLSALLAVSITAQSLMMAYLKRQDDLHLAQQRAIDAQYPLLYRDLIDQYATSFNLDPSFVAAIIRNESSFRPAAESAVGARGLMQLMPDTAEWIARKLRLEGYAFERMYDPESNIRFGCWYLNYLSRLFQGDPVSVSCAYHAGQGEILSWLSDSTRTDDGVRLLLNQLPEGPTKQYAERVTRDYGIYKIKYYSSAQPDPVDDADAVTAAGGGLQRR